MGVSIASRSAGFVTRVLSHLRRRRCAACCCHAARRTQVAGVAGVRGQPRGRRGRGGRQQRGARREEISHPRQPAALAAHQPTKPSNHSSYPTARPPHWRGPHRQRCSPRSPHGSLDRHASVPGPASAPCLPRAGGVVGVARPLHHAQRRVVLRGGGGRGRRLRRLHERDDLRIRLRALDAGGARAAHPCTQSLARLPAPVAA
jgi:hypothetical protein